MVRAFAKRFGRGVGLAVGGLAIAVLCSPVAAADLSGADDLLAKAPQIEATSGWYLRGDIGYVINEKPKWSQLNFDPVFTPTVDDAFLVGIGAGVRLNDWLRVDVTGDYRSRADYAYGPLSSDLSVATALANVYVDFAKWGSVTPYFGGGVGAGYMSVSDIELLGTDIGKTDGWGIAWALMAGVAISTGPNWQVDVGYRYLNLDGVSLGAGLPDLNQTAHEIRLGARYLID